MLDLSEDPRRHIIQGPLVGSDLRRLGGRDQAVISDRRTFLFLLRLDQSQQPGRDQAPGEGCFLTEQHDVERIPVFRARARYEAEVERKDRADGENLVK